MKLQVIIFCLVLFGTAVSGFAVSGNNEYCPINPRKGGQTLVPNHDAFSFLLSCPVGKTKWEGPSQEDIYNEWEKLYFEGRPNSHRVSADTDVFLYETSYTNGVNDVRQAACVNWDHAFIADTKAALLVTGSGKPIIVGQDRRFENQETNSSNILPFGQWIYSICSDVTCTEVTVPKPFWGRRIGDPLFQDTMAELAYFPFPPDWAYNSPRLGVTLNVQDSPDSFGNPLNPSEIAHTYVTNENDESLLVLLLNGYTVNKVGFDIQDFFNPPSNSFWYLAWCQDEDCESWGVYQLPIGYNQTFSNTDTVRPAISAVGDVVTIVTRESHDQYEPRVLTLRLRSLDVTGPYRLEAFSEIYANLIGANYELTSNLPPSNLLEASLLVDEQIYHGLYNDVHPLNYLYGGRGVDFFSGPFPNTRPSVACVDLEASGVHSDPWCHWTSYWELVSDFAGHGFSSYIGNLEYPSSGTFYDLVYDSCQDQQYLVVSPLDNPNSYATFEPINSDGSFSGFRLNWINPSPFNEFLRSVNYTLPSPSPHGFNSTTTNFQTFPMTGRRFTAIQGANGRPFFSWADLRGHLLDAPNVWGTCALNLNNDFECRTILDSIELGTFGFLRAQYGQTKVLQGPDGLPVLIFWFDHFGGYQNDAIVSDSLQVVPGQVTSKPLIVNCLDAFCDSASISTIAPAQLADIANIGKYEEVNPTVNVDAAFVGDNLVLLLNEGGRFGESTANPIRLWRTNRWASPTGMPCSEQNAGQRAVADDVVYYCTRIQLGSQDAELFVGEYPRPWTRLYEWVRMDWGYGLRNLGAFLGWGSNFNDQAFYDIAADKDPWWTDNSETYLQTGHGQQPLNNNNE